MLLLFAGINFLIFVGLLIWAGRRPLRKFWLRRRGEIKNEIETGQRALNDARVRNEAALEREANLGQECEDIQREITENMEATCQQIKGEAERYATWCAQATQDQKGKNKARLRRRALHKFRSQVAYKLENDLRAGSIPPPAEGFSQAGISFLEKGSVK